MSKSKKYIFDVQFEYLVEAESYEQAVRLASDQLPDENGKTTFIVNTLDYGFLPNQETLKKMHEWEDCACHNPNVVAVNFETGEIVSDES